jgi:predicted nucleic acid-binding Zn ribbon protein
MSPWRPLPPEVPPDPRSVQESLAGLARRLGIPDPVTLAAVFDRWRETVGPGLAAHAEPLSLVDGVLTLAVEESAVATHVRYLTPELRARLGEVVGEGVVRRVEVRVRPR